MKIITINLSELYLKTIQMLIDQGKEASRSQCIRNALDEFINEDLEFRDQLKREVREHKNRYRKY